MATYDYIQDPISGQPISSSLFGANVKKAINDLDRRMSAYDASTGIGKAFATTTLNVTSNVEVAGLTIPSFTFRAGYAYKATMRSPIAGATGGLFNIRARKYNTTPANGADLGEFYRYETKGAGFPMGALGTIYILNSSATDVVTDVSLTFVVSVGTTFPYTVYANTTSPRYFVIEPAGFAVDFAGMGVNVT